MVTNFIGHLELSIINAVLILYLQRKEMSEVSHKSQNIERGVMHIMLLRGDN
jgi:hypothetical protein